MLEPLHIAAHAFAHALNSTSRAYLQVLLPSKFSSILLCFFLRSAVRSMAYSIPCPAVLFSTSDHPHARAVHRQHRGAYSIAVGRYHRCHPPQSRFCQHSLMCAASLFCSSLFFRFFFLAAVGENQGHDREEHDQHLPARGVAGVLEWQRGQHSQDHAGERDTVLGVRDVQKQHLQGKKETAGRVFFPAFDKACLISSLLRVAMEKTQKMNSQKSRWLSYAAGPVAGLPSNRRISIRSHKYADPNSLFRSDTKFN